MPDMPADPRPAPSSMFDMLTLDDLYELHAQVCAELRAVHSTMMNGLEPLIPPMSPAWALMSAKCAELDETAAAVYAEITRRERELISDPGSPVLRRILDGDVYDA